MLGVVAVKNLLDGPPPVFDIDVAAIATCSGCGCALPPHAVYCVECGRCELSQTDQGTRIVRSPYAPAPPVSDLPEDEPIPPPPDFGSGPFAAAEPTDAPQAPEIPYAEEHATVPVAPLETNPDLSLSPADFEARTTTPHEPVVDTRAVTQAVDTQLPQPQRAAPLPVPPKRSRPSGGYLIGPKATRSVEAVSGVVETREANVRTLSRPARRWAPTGIARLDTAPRKDTAVTRAPAPPAPYWDAPPKGNTVKRRAPKPGT